MDWSSGLQIHPEKIHARIPVTVFHLQGRLNMGNARLLEEAARQAMEGGNHYFLLDLGELESLTSAGLRTIQWLYKTTLDSQPVIDPAPAVSPYLKLACASPDVGRVLRLAGFDTFIGVYDSLDEALQSF